MGRWSWTIMGSDSALDLESHICEVCDIDLFSEEESEETNSNAKESLEQHKDELLAILENNDDMLVLCVVFMRYGAAISEEMKKQALRDAKSLKKHWPETENLDEFIATLKVYDNQTPTEIASQGLFEALFDSVSKGETGLINK